MTKTFYFISQNIITGSQKLETKTFMIISLVPCLELKSFQMLPPFYQGSILILLI